MEDKVTESIAEKFQVMGPLLNERGKRLWGAVEARSLGRGGVINNCYWVLPGKLLAGEYPRNKPVDERSSERKLNRLLHEMGYSLQSNRKTVEGRQHPDRDRQFRHVNRKTEECQRRGDPVVSVDTKKKELVGNFRNAGREWRPKGDPERVLVHDFKDAELGKAIPYGVYDLAANNGWVGVGVDHDTAAFAVRTLRRWWERMGRAAYPAARRLLVTADAGGSNGCRSRLWKVELQRFADDTGLEVSVRHFPPGTSKWNKIEHRMFCWITQNWRGRPLVSREAVVELIGNTITSMGLSIQTELDPNSTRRASR